MKRIFLLLIFFFASPSVFAQQMDKFDGGHTVETAILKDKNYSFKEILSGNLLQFKAKDSLLGKSSYWVRIILKHQRIKHGLYLTIYPNFDTKLYCFDRVSEQWIFQRSYLDDRKLRLGEFFYEKHGKEVDTLYAWIDLRAAHVAQNKFKFTVKVETKEKSDQASVNNKLAWLIGLVVLSLFFLNNLYLYFVLRDRPVFFYLVIQVGAIGYLTTYWYGFISNTYVFSGTLSSRYLVYDVNNLVQHLAILTVFYGYVQLTKTYLNTPRHLPRENRLLNYVLNFYIIVSILVAAINLSGFHLEYYTIVYDNIYCALLISCILLTVIRAYLRKLQFSESYLLANLVPLFSILLIPLQHVLTDGDAKYNIWIQIFGIVSQALCFSLALVNRTKSIQETLNLREIESKELEFSLKEVGYQNKLNEMQMVKMDADMQLEKNRNQLLQERLELQQRELASSTLIMVQKSELLTFLKGKLQQLNWMDRYHTKRNLHELNQLLESNIQLDSDWSKFKMHFEQVHPNFFQNLKRDYPSLTQKEIRLYTYFKMQLSHKEIAALLDIEQPSVRRAKTRLYKKMGISFSGDQPST